jgi:hypothetical protein
MLKRLFPGFLARLRLRLRSHNAGTKQPMNALPLTIVVFAVLTVHSATASEFSVRCEGQTPPRPYFATFDTDAKRVVFESAPSDVKTFDGSNVIVGEIDGQDDPDGRIEFTLDLSRLSRGKLSFIFDRKNKTMFWPGLDDGFRPTLTHSCTVSSPRSLLSFRSPVPVGHPITVRCEDSESGYLTMDVDSKRAMFERGGRGSLYRGQVISVHNGDIDLVMEFGGHPRQMTWSKATHTLTIEAAAGDGQRPRMVLQCQEIPPRTMIEYYKLLRR